MDGVGAPGQPETYIVRMPTEPYREHRPHVDLAPFVACYWTIRRGARPDAGIEHVVPDGCLDFLFDLSTGEGRLVGTMTRPLAVDRSRAADLLGVRFRSGAGAAFVEVPADDVTDGMAGLSDAGAVVERHLPARLAEAQDTSARTALLDATLMASLASAPDRDDPLARYAAERVVSSGGTVAVDDLADAVGLGRRQLERRFRAAVGVSPGTARRVARFQAAVRILATDAARPLSWVALDAGYHDQAHLTREFGRLAGETPAAYRTRRHDRA